MCAVSLTPVEPRRQVYSTPRFCLPLSCDNVGLHGYAALGAQSHGPHAPCLRFAGEVALAPRKTRFRLVTNPARAGFLPQGPYRRFRLSSISSLPPSPSFPGALSAETCGFAS